MAEKEERIFISQTSSPDGFRDENATVIGYTRQEAIERMARALHRESARISSIEKDFDKLYADYRKSFYNYAKAALDALLED